MKNITLSKEAMEALEEAENILTNNPNAIIVDKVEDVPKKGKALGKPEDKPQTDKPKQKKFNKTWEKEAKERTEKAKADEKKAEIAKAQEQKLKAKEQAALERELKRRAGTIDKNLASIETSFLVIAFNLHWIKRNGMHKTAGYKNIYDYAENEHGLGRTTCCNLICIVDNFAKRDADGNILDEIDDCYKRFKQSQLVAMSGMSPVLIEQIDEKTSVRDILKLKKESEIDGGEGEDGGNGGDDGKTGKSGKKPIIEMKREILTQFGNFNDYMQKLEDTEAKIQKAIKKYNGNVTIQIVCISIDEEKSYV